MWTWVKNKRAKLKTDKVDTTVLVEAPVVIKPNWIVGQLTSFDKVMPEEGDEIEAFVRSGWNGYRQHELADMADEALKAMLEIRGVTYVGIRPKAAAGSNFSFILGTAYPLEEVYVSGRIHMAIWIPDEIPYRAGKHTLYTRNANGVPNLMVVAAINNLSYQTGLRMTSWINATAGSYVIFHQPHDEGFFNLPTFLALIREAEEEKY